MFRQVPNDTENCLVVYTEALSEDTQQAVISCVELLMVRTVLVTPRGGESKLFKANHYLTHHVGNFMNKVPQVKLC